MLQFLVILDGKITRWCRKYNLGPSKTSAEMATSMFELFFSDKNVLWLNNKQHKNSIFDQSQGYTCCISAEFSSNKSVMFLVHNLYIYKDT